MTSFADFLEHLRKRPGMYLGNEPAHHLYGLHCLVLGVSVAELMYDLPTEGDSAMGEYNSFERWVELHKMPKRRSINSFGKAAWEADSDRAAFDLWFAWRDEFQREHRATTPSSPETSSPPGQEGTGEVDRPSAPPPTS